MRLRLLEKSLKRFYLKLEAAVNKRLGREFIPAGPGSFNIETSSACNLKCRFCAYEKKSSPRLNMPEATFADTVEQALTLGFNEFHLTPTTGDVFMDKRVYEKFDYLEAHPGVRAYHFFTNLTIPTPAQIEQLIRLKKLSRITVSIYGHDEASFIAIAQAPAKVHQRLLDNLEALLALRERWPFALTFGFRSTFDAPSHTDGPLLDLLARFKAAGVPVHASHGLYNNWGGYITQADVAGLNVRILDGRRTPKLGPCVKLFDGFQVMATGVVNGCSCRDVDATLQIGHVGEQPLASILSGDNPRYRAIIDEQERGEFRPVCEGCDFYRSIYHLPSSFRRAGTAMHNRRQFFATLESQ